jgi:hypothetical protein
LDFLLDASGWSDDKHDISSFENVQFYS